MKSAKPSPADATSSRRSQPVRQTRTNPPRSSVGVGRSGAGRHTLGAAPPGDQPIDIFPAITHFADAITALPKELVRHFTLLKEVDAKSFAPEGQLFRLVAAASSAPLPEPRQHIDASSSAASVADPVGATEAVNAVLPITSAPSAVSTADDHSVSAFFDPSNLQRRQLFRQTAFKIQEMLVALEEKNHVITTANEALQRQLARVEDVWPYLENEFSEEAKWGSTTHWAYPENRIGKNSHAERARREGAAVISAAAQALVEEAAARSDARKQAVQARRNLKNSHLGSDVDDINGRQRAEGSKRAPQSKVRKTAEASSIGLGITASSSSAPGIHPPKRRKVEKDPNGAVPMERAMSAALNNNMPKARTSSPRGTPAPDAQKKRKALPSGSSQPKKRYDQLDDAMTISRGADILFYSRNGVQGQSPPITSSPVLGALADPKIPTRSSPAPGNVPRPATSRARQNSLQSLTDNAKPRPSSSASNKQNGKTAGTPDLAPPASWPKPASDPKPAPEASLPVKPEVGKKEPAEGTETPPTPIITESKKETKVEENDRKSESVPPPLSSSIITVTTKSGRASKPSTPALATFQEAARARPSRSTDNGNNHKKHQKRGSTASQALAPPLVEDDGISSAPGDEEEGEIDADEPRYCYCNGVSYGEMVACDSDECAREWFHLACVGLKVAPGSKSESLFLQTRVTVS